MAWLEALQLPEHVRSGGQDPQMAMSVQIWNLMGGQIDWAGLPVLAETLGIMDVEMLIFHLVAIRDSRDKS